jgi:CIC family chloride channel protein
MKQDSPQQKAPDSPTRYRLAACCVLMGALGAIAALLFDRAVDTAQTLLLTGIGGYTPPPVGILNAIIQEMPWAERWRLPLSTVLGGLLGGALVFSLAPEAEGHGTDAAIGAYHQSGGALRKRVPFIKGIASALTIGSGGVAGREGPTAQISVGLGAIVGSFLRLSGEERRILLLASMAAGLAAVFRSPLGMAIFAVEILYSGMVFESEALIYTVIAAVSAYAIHGFFVGWAPIYAIPPGLIFDHPESLLAFAALGILAGGYGAILPTLFYRVRNLFHRLPGPRHFHPAIGALVVGLMGMAVPAILGTGYGWIEIGLAGRLSLGFLLLVALLKAPAMALTIGSGGAGGVFAPTVTMGALLGAAVGLAFQQWVPALHASPAAFAIVGMAAIFAGAARTPISTLIMVVEMTGGYGLIVPAMLCNVLAFAVQSSITSGWRYPTLYENQVARREDSAAHRGMFVRQALEMIEGGGLETSEIPLPHLVSLLRYGDAIPLGQGGGSLVSVVVSPGSRLAGNTVREGLGDLEGVTAVATLRGEETILARGPTPLDAGDQLVAVVTEAAQPELLRRAAPPAVSTNVSSSSLPPLVQ